MKQQYDNSRNTSFTCDCREYTETSLWGLSLVTYFNTWQVTLHLHYNARHVAMFKWASENCFETDFNWKKEKPVHQLWKEASSSHSLTFRAEITEDFVFALIVLTFWPSGLEQFLFGNGVETFVHMTHLMCVENGKGLVWIGLNYWTGSTVEILVSERDIWQPEETHLNFSPWKNTLCCSNTQTQTVNGNCKSSIWKLHYFKCQMMK